MAVIKDIICPNCRRPNPAGQGFIHDKEQNLICQHCSGVMFATAPETEKRVKRPDGFSKKEALAIKQGLGEIPYEKGARTREVYWGGYCC